MRGSRKPVFTICRHKKPQNQCRTCVILTFILCRIRINAPRLGKDIHSVIFSRLPNEIIVPSLPVGEAYEFKKFRSCVSMKITDKNYGLAICGFEIERKDSPFRIYCAANATDRGCSDYFTCRKHATRKTPSAGISNHCTEKISLKGMKYRME